jgi:hypothetical protein
MPTQISTQLPPYGVVRNIRDCKHYKLDEKQSEKREPGILSLCSSPPSVTETLSRTWTHIHECGTGHEMLAKSTSFQGQAK